MTASRRCVLAVGVFDGVHAGHRRILSALAARACETGASPAVLTFRNHPLAVLAPERVPGLLCPVEERVLRIGEAAPGAKVAVEDFTPSLAATPPDGFIAILLRRFGAIECVFCGGNWRFGRGGAGNAASFRAAGIETREIPPAMYAGERVSSTRIREAVREGRMEAAAAMLERPFALYGTVRSGKGEGRSLGFPTVNAEPDGDLCLPPRGVYETEGGISNFGVAPTFGGRAWKSPVLETHYFGTQPDTKPGGRVSVPLLRFVRPERTFSGAEELQAAVERDIASVRGSGPGR